ncbi:GILT-like protein 3 [Drosophila nasuta]|uniref:GILT-like protein 3 n=1 Tax=Drosophila nasuta TaxID=42062 RepID=UPI00295E8323|nr:GILT-like protein 3 [Drosophila nasuta]
MYFIQHRLHDALQENNWWPRVDLKLYSFGTAKFFNNTDLNLMEVHCQHGKKQSLQSRSVKTAEQQRRSSRPTAKKHSLFSCPLFPVLCLIMTL